MARPAGTADDFRVLGPVSVVRDGQPVELGGVRQRQLLALLLLQPGRAVSVDRLVDELWQGEPPGGAEGTLRVYASRLRSALGPDVVMARPPGYALAVDPDRVDATRFERWCHEGRDALARGAAGTALERLSAALSLCRGPAYADVRGAGALADEAVRLDELHSVAREDRCDAQLALGRHATVVEEAERLLADQPLRERTWRQLVVALHGAGRPAEAVATIGRARRVLSEGLGVDDTDLMRDLERAVRRGELPLPTPVEERHNLPARWTSFVGRDEEAAALTDLLRSHRLVTLTGPGGVGKTRLAVETAARLVSAWSAGVWLVDLTACGAGAPVAAAVAEVVGIRERPGAGVVADLAARLRDQEALLLLDNCEHVVEECAQLVDTLLRRAPWLRVLATSRLPLGVPGEAERAVTPLPTPAGDQEASAVERVPSVGLLLDRVHAVRPGIASSPEHLLLAARICRELDGLPLAIELAAARAKTLSLEDIAGRLDERLDFLRSSRGAATPRHRSLRAALDWSHDLLDEEEQSLFAALAVFAGGFSAAAVAEVWAHGRTARAEEALGRLVDASLLVVREGPAGPRYGMLQTVAEYAAERLAASDDRQTLQRAHATCMLAFAQRTWTEDPEGKARALALFDAERDNLDAAVRWAVDAGSELALPLAASSWRYWLLRGRRRHGRDLLEAALGLPDDAPDRLRAFALAGAALLSRLLGESDRAQELAEEGVTVGRKVGPPRALAVCLNVLVSLSSGRGDLDTAHRYAEESTTVARAAGDQRLEALSLFILAEGLLHDGRTDEAAEVGGRALVLARQVGDPEVVAIVLARLGLGDLERERWPAGAEHLAEALHLARDLGFHETAAWCCDGLALVSAHSGNAVRAARLLGAGESLRRTGGSVVQPAEERVRAAVARLLAGSRTAEEVDEDTRAGLRLSFDEATAEALAAAPPAPLSPN